MHNFGAGPAVLPAAVLATAQSELLDYHETGMSVMEMSHRSKEFEEILQNATNNIKTLLSLPDNYHILFLQGGATNQFSSILFNLLTDMYHGNEVVDYFVSGTWSQKAYQEATRHLGSRANLVYNSKNGVLPSDWKSECKWSTKPSFFYYCENETINGVEFTGPPSNLFHLPYEVPIVCDMSSNILSRPIPHVNKLSVIIAGAQKNLGPAGLTIVILKDEILDLHRNKLHKHVIPIMMDYFVAQANNSLYNTPPTYPIYIAGLVLEWIKKNGGIKWIENKNAEKAQLLYNQIDDSEGFYNCPVSKSLRSRMNVPFRIFGKDGKPSEQLEKVFIKGATEKGLLQLAGHRSVGGIRASLYNALDISSVIQLVNFMKNFKSESVN